MRRSPMQALAASPTMVGAITTLIVVVAVFLAYNANNGLPFVPTYKVSVDIPNASRLVRNNEVRIGGSRVGVVESIEAVSPAGDGDGTSAKSGDSDGGGSDTPSVVARLNLKLDKNAEPLTVDSVFRVRYKSSFGLKYLEITRGDGADAAEGFRFDGTNDVNDVGATPLTLADAREIQAEAEEAGEDEDGVFVEQTEFDDISNTFDTRTRQAGRQNLTGFGTAFAGRGGSLNQAIEALNPLLRGLKPVTDVLLEDSTRFSRLFPELGDAARIVAPVAREQAELFTNMAITFGALSEDPEALKATISEGPPTLETGIALLPRQRGFLNDFTELSSRLRPGIRQLRIGLPDLNAAVSKGTEVLPDTVPTNEALGDALGELEKLVDSSATGSAIDRLRDTFKYANPLARHVTPAQTVCNYWNYWFTFLPEHLTEQDNVGYNQRVSILTMPRGRTVLEAGGVPIVIPGAVQGPLGGYSGIQANGRSGATGVFDPYTNPILHGPPYAPTGQKGTNADCQSGQTGYPLGAGPLKIKGQPQQNPAVGASDYPGSRGPTDLFYSQTSERSLEDTRVEARQP